MLPLIYHASYSKLALPATHQFPGSKYQHLYEYLIEQGIALSCQFLAPEKVTQKYLTQLHEPSYVASFIDGSIDSKALRRIGFPWSKALVERTLYSVAGTALTCEQAIEHGCALHLSGGYHHAHHEYGSGYCIFNDLALAAMHSLQNDNIETVLIFDCDVHQGDGTATIVQSNNNIITCSLHCQENFPSRKQQSDYDIEIARGTEDKQYLETVTQTLAYLIRLHQPDLIIYDAGVDIHQDDRLGYLQISDQGLLERDKLILQQAKSANIPIACVIGGGYSKDITQLTQRHSQLFIAANDVWQ
ncbi:histone deacetylase family protein [Shewanella fidelis]|uniref:Histone deacetylase n=1 Tax=Shewanella fidelis TaxID=173509 RepID=A0AAW8NK78_9GAMM|nr:histone deacetylase [Shewanella fidelis]MDR8523252.1 histone deacetylase [Shewanella fidelis]MDW4811422.1 histone deacetylase [Shewanella fidelis]MDW4815543.1 histone deacetylase [Shewanella fidelis]MDW4819633.1 histone deacetylase [Shewanella fidelis]MDW4824393.1 histone deacetylase [Shewanella fidelis]